MLIVLIARLQNACITFLYHRRRSESVMKRSRQSGGADEGIVYCATLSHISVTMSTKSMIEKDTTYYVNVMFHIKKIPIPCILNIE